MKPSTLHREVHVNASLEDVFAFHADARNLERITPPWLRFEILTPVPVDMREGTRIDYRIRMRGIPMRWQSEIIEWNPPHGFVDVQRRGPYRQWVHTHAFARTRGGTRITDAVQYSVPGGIIVDRLFVRRDVERIFDYRMDCLREIFGSGLAVAE